MKAPPSPRPAAHPTPARARILAAAAIFALLIPLPTPTAAQRLPDPSPGNLAALSVPRFAIPPSPIELTGPVRPGEYLGVTGKLIRDLC